MRPLRGRARAAVARGRRSRGSPNGGRAALRGRGPRRQPRVCGCGDLVPGSRGLGIGTGRIDGASERQCAVENTTSGCRVARHVVAEPLGCFGVEQRRLARPDDEVVVAHEVLARLGRVPAGARVAEVERGLVGDRRGKDKTVDAPLIMGCRRGAAWPRLPAEFILRVRVAARACARGAGETVSKGGTPVGRDCGPRSMVAVGLRGRQGIPRSVGRVGSGGGGSSTPPTVRSASSTRGESSIEGSRAALHERKPRGRSGLRLGQSGRRTWRRVARLESRPTGGRDWARL